MRRQAYRAVRTIGERVASLGMTLRPAVVVRPEAGTLDTMASDAEFLVAFEAQRWPLEDWHHRDHIRLAYLYLRALPFEQAADRIRRGIKAHNDAHRVPDVPTSGFHETMTVAWLHLVAAILAEYGPEATAGAFCDAHPELLEKKTLRLFYSKERMMSAEAKRAFVEPDLAPLTRARISAGAIIAGDAAKDGGSRSGRGIGSARPGAS